MSIWLISAIRAVLLSQGEVFKNYFGLKLLYPCSRNWLFLKPNSVRVVAGFPWCNFKYCV